MTTELTISHTKGGSFERKPCACCYAWLALTVWLPFHQIMPQPDSNSAFYFSHDADMRNDIKVKALRKEHGHTGYAVWCFILETLTASENFEVGFDELNQELLANDFDTTPETLTAIVQLCCKVGLLKVKDNHLSCNALTRRFQALNEQRERRRETGRRNIAKRWNKSVETDDRTPEVSDSNALSLNNNGIADDSNKNIIEENIIEKKKKEEIVNIPYQEIVALWNSTCIALPKVKTLSDDRRQKMRCRLTEAKMTASEDMVQWCSSLFRRITQSAFLCGENNHSWTATFDWVFENSKNWVKVMEGNYDNNRGAKSARLAVDCLCGAGEYFTPDGKRTYGSGRVEIPLSAPKRPSERHQWNAETQEWVLL
jgi:hypothetical protein